MSVITLSTNTDAPGTEQVIKQLNKLIDVIKIVPYDLSTQLLRDVALVRVRVKEDTRAEILALSAVFRAHVVDASPRSYIFEVTGQPDKIKAFLQNMRLYGIQDIHRTGCLALSRGSAEGKQAQKPIGLTDVDPPESVASST